MRGRCAQFGIEGAAGSSGSALRLSGSATRLADVLIGSHVIPEDPLAAAAAEGADLVQIFLGNPQSWKEPKPREDAQTLKASALPLYVHAPYLINVASANNRVRIPSRKILQDTCDAASEIGATAVIVHGGHADDNDMEAGFERWVKALASLETDVAVYLENTAGGDRAMARHFDVIARLWDHIGDKGIGFCLDTCHAWAAGEKLVDAVDRIMSITGRIDLVHCNDSRMPRARARPARQLRRRTDRPRPVGRGRQRRRRAGGLRNRRRGPQGRHRVSARARRLTRAQADSPPCSGALLVLAGCAASGQRRRKASLRARTVHTMSSAASIGPIVSTCRPACRRPLRWWSCCTAASAVRTRPKEPTAGTNWRTARSLSSPIPTGWTGRGTSRRLLRSPRAEENIDDVGFITAVVNDIAGNVGVDAKRVYATGISNGGMMAYTLACNTGTYAAIGPDSATQLDACRSPHPTSVMHIHGTADRLIPYNGGPGMGVAHIDGPAVPDLNAFWRNVDQCGAPAVSTDGAVTTSTADCADGRNVVLMTVDQRRTRMAVVRHPGAVDVLRRALSGCYTYCAAVGKM